MGIGLDTEKKLESWEKFYSNKTSLLFQTSSLSFNLLNHFSELFQLRGAEKLSANLGPDFMNRTFISLKIDAIAIFFLFENVCTTSGCLVEVINQAKLLKLSSVFA